MLAETSTYDDDEEVDDLPRIALNIQDEGVGNTRRRTKDDDDLHRCSLGKHKYSDGGVVYARRVSSGRSSQEAVICL